MRTHYSFTLSSVKIKNVEELTFFFLYKSMGGENKMGSIRLIKQQDETDCGVVCLAMILNHYGTDIPLYKLREFSGTNLEGTSAFGLNNVLRL